uniref:Plant-specific domain TIGR01615 family protein n=2 Tax=Rhizophora mucronata TaxID=61149 RepID=A0A2P2KIR6_RHIMU
MSAATATGDWLLRGIVGQTRGGFSHDSEHDLALMVSDFLENGGSSGADSLCSSDSDSGLSDLRNLADKISFYKCSIPQHENDFLSLIHSLMQSIKDADLFPVKSGPCNASCTRFSLAKLLRLSGHDAAVCVSRWQGSSKVPGGDHEYIDVIHYKNAGSSERLIIDIDFRSHFEIARAVHSYDRILKSLPVIFVGSLTRLKQYLQVMVEAAKSSLKQNSMPLPPWRSFAYLQAKWYSPYQRHLGPDEQNLGSIKSSDHMQCSGHLKRLQLLLLSEMEEERLLKAINSDTNWRMKLEKRRHSFFRGL